jgi:hypothetical protein
MRNLLLALTSIATLVPLATAQDSSAQPPVTMRENSQVVSNQPGAEPVMRKNSSYEPPFCPPKTCLYYAGDFDSADSNANGLYNENDESAGVVGQAWVGVRPDRDATVTGATFVGYVFNNGQVGVNPTPFEVRVGIKPGQAGTTICSTRGNATVSIYQYNEDYSIYSYTIKKLSKSCKLKKGNVYYVNLLPTYSSGDYAYVVNVEDAKPKNHHGWKNDLNHCYFNSAYYGANYVTCNSLGIGSHGYSELSIALTGKE